MRRLPVTTPSIRSCAGAATADRDGFLAAGLDLTGKKVLILGAGGVSHMMAHEALAKNAKIWICARNQEKLTNLHLIFRASGGTDIAVISEEDLHHASDISTSDISAGDVDVILNGTPLGMWPFCGEAASPPSIFRPGQQVFDSIYNPAATKWALQARKNGAKVSGGLNMLSGRPWRPRRSGIRTRNP